MPIYLMSIRVLLSVELCVTLKTYLKGAPFYNACESRAFCAIGKLGGKVWFWTFPRSGFSTAVSPAVLCFFLFLHLRTAVLRRHFRTEPPIRQVVNALQFLINQLPQLKRVQTLAQLFLFCHRLWLRL